MPNTDNSPSQKLLAELTVNLTGNENQILNEIFERMPEKSFNWESFKTEMLKTGFLSEQEVDHCIDIAKRVFVVHDKECEDNCRC